MAHQPTTRRPPPESAKPPTQSAGGRISHQDQTPCSIGQPGADDINSVPAELIGTDERTTMKPGCSTRLVVPGATRPDRVGYGRCCTPTDRRHRLDRAPRAVEAVGRVEPDRRAGAVGTPRASARPRSGCCPRTMAPRHPPASALYSRAHTRFVQGPGASSIQPRHSRHRLQSGIPRTVGGHLGRVGLAAPWPQPCRRG